MTAIQDRIMDAHRDSRTAIVYGAPVNFSVPEMSNEDASILIYYSILQSLEKKGFEAIIEKMSTSETTFLISWSDTSNKNSLSHMVKYIACRRSDNKVKFKVPKSSKKKIEINSEEDDPQKIHPNVFQYMETLHEKKQPMSSSSTDMSARFSSISMRSGHKAEDSLISDVPPPIPDMFKEPSKNKSTNYLNDYNGLI